MLFTFFVYCSNVSDSGVYAYDPTNYLSENHPAESVFKVYATSEFNFHPESFVKGDITYVQKKESLAVECMKTLLCCFLQIIETSQENLMF